MKRRRESRGRESWHLRVSSTEKGHQVQKVFDIHKVKPGESFPVKIQVSLSAGSDSTLIYGKDRVPMTLADGELPRSMGENLLYGRDKGYFNAHFTEDGQLSIDEAIPDQKW